MEFVDTYKIISKQEQIIRDATGKVIILSPYLQMNDYIKNLLVDKYGFHPKKEIIIVTGKKALLPNELKSLNRVIKQSKNKITHLYNENLHAKIVLSDKEALVSSMNLYDASKNNFEAGFYFSESDRNTEIFLDIKRFVETIAYNRMDKYQTATIEYDKQYLKTRNYALTYENYKWLNKTKTFKDSPKTTINDAIEKARIMYEQTSVDVDGETVECKNGVFEGFKNACRRANELWQTNQEVCNENDSLITENERLKSEIEKLREQQA